jgi:uncharacterized protein YegL
MTDSDYTHIALVVDRSGSMHGIATDMDGAIKELLTAQAKEPGYVLVDVVTFDTEVEFPYTDARPDDVKGQIIVARGMTALNDAVGKTIVSLGEKLAAKAEEDRPAHVIVVIVTDGHENSSREYTLARVQQMVLEQQDKWDWNFLYLAANVDAFATGSAYGFNAGQTMGYAATAEGTQSVIATASASMTRTRSGLSGDFTDEEREDAVGG